MSIFPRARFGAAVAVAFFCGLVFASGMDLTKFGWAQSRVATSNAAQLPMPAVASLAETQNAFETIVDRVKPAVVTIHVTKYATPASQQRRNRRSQSQGQGQLPPGFEDFMKQFGGDVQVPDPGDQGREGAGSGFIVSKDGYILTNNHVVAGMDRVQVTLVDKRTFTAKVIGRDSTTDVALIKIDGDNFPTVPLGDDATARVGQWVLALGNPLDLDFTVTAGIISAKGRSNLPLPGRNQYSITDFIQTDAAINPGNSGGPLVNIRGEVIGINSAIASGTGYYAGYGFAVPIGLAREVMNDLKNYGVVRRAIVGVSLQEVTPEDAQAAGLKEIRGAKVVEYSDDSPAKKAGVEIGDIIIGADDKPIDQVSTLQRIIRGHSVGETVKLDIQRFGQLKQINVKLGELAPVKATEVADNSPSESSGGGEAKLPTKSFDKIGLTVSAVPAAVAAESNLPAADRSGLLVTNVAARSDAHDKGVATGYDVVEQELYPTRRDIKSMSDLDQAVAGLKTGDVLTLRIYTLGIGNKVVSLRIP